MFGIMYAFILAGIGISIAYSFNYFGIPFEYYTPLITAIGSIILGSVGFKIGYNGCKEKCKTWKPFDRFLNIVPGIGGLLIVVIMVIKNIGMSLVIPAFFVSAVVLFIGWEAFERSGS